LGCVFALAWFLRVGGLNLSVGRGTQAKTKPELDQGCGWTLAAYLLSSVSIWCRLLAQGEYWPEIETQA